MRINAGEAIEVATQGGTFALGFTVCLTNISCLVLLLSCVV